MMELVDMQLSKSCAYGVRDRSPLPAPSPYGVCLTKRNRLLAVGQTTSFNKKDGNNMEQPNNFESQFIAMEADFAKCAKDNISPCFFCANDETCTGIPENCQFKWQSHN